MAAQNQLGEFGRTGDVGAFAKVDEVATAAIGGRRGSLQLFVEGASSAKSRTAGVTLERAAAEKLRVFDFVIGNADRGPANLMVRDKRGKLRDQKRGKKLPVGIDHGLNVAGCGRRLDAGAFFGNLRRTRLATLLETSDEKRLIASRAAGDRSWACKPLG